jgi:hypothetical protein
LTSASLPRCSFSTAKFFRHHRQVYARLAGAAGAWATSQLRELISTPPVGVDCRLGTAVKGGAMSILISVLITFVVVILVLYLVNMLPLDGRVKQIIQVIVIIIGILSLLRYLAVF